MLRLQTPLDERYTAAPSDELARRIAAAKDTLGERLFILGDLTHSPVIANETAWENTFDWDKPLARSTRERVLAELESDGTLTGVGHYPHPGFGRFARVDGKRRWVPIT